MHDLTVTGLGRALSIISDLKTAAIVVHAICVEFDIPITELVDAACSYRDRAYWTSDELEACVRSIESV